MKVNVMKVSVMKNLLYLFPALFLWAVIRYAVDKYSPVPFWDTWDGFMSVVDAVRNGDFSVIFSKHNEHRITLARLLFLGDYYLFQSHFSVLIAINIVLMLISFSLFVYLSRKHFKKIDTFYLCLVGCLVFLMCQEENIRWEFESQFFLAQIIPLAAFIFFSKALNNDHELKNSRCFFVSISLAILANFTMGNGFLASMIIFASLFFVKSNIVVKSFSALTVVVSCSMIFLGKNNVNSEIPGLNDLVPIINYFLVWLGSPFYHIVEFYWGNTLSIEVSGLFGFVFCVMSAYFFKEGKKRNGRYALAAVCMIVYVILSAGLAAVSRYQSGVFQATSSRYTTPVLIGWISLLMLLWPTIDKHKWVVRGGSILCMLVLFLYQQLVGKDKVNVFYYETPFYGDVLMMSLWMGVDDPEMMKKLHPHPDRIRQVVNERRQDAGFFTNSSRYINMQGAFSSAYELGQEPIGQCVMYVDGIRNLEDAKYQYAHGWLKYEHHDGKMHFFLVYDQNHEKVGYLVVGRSRRDVSRHYSDHEVNVGFGGYLSGDFLKSGTLLYFYNPETRYLCSHTMRFVE